MRVTLFDFQKDALDVLRQRLQAVRHYASEKSPQVFPFSAPTGSGKTLMTAALFEAILDEPDDPSRDDNVDKVRGLARFAERHGALFGRIQLIRKRKVAGGAEQFVRLEINRVETMQRLLLVTTASQLDALFDGVH